jgi:hypothetical protein
MTQFGTVIPAPQNSGIANWQEFGAFAIAQAIKVALSFALSFSGLLTPIYTWAYRIGGVTSIVLVSAAISVFWASMLLVLFLALRGALGGVPTMIAVPGREHAVTSGGGEIGAYVIAAALLIAVLTALNSAVLGPIYVSLNHDGQRSLATALALTTSAAGAAVVYAVFIGLRAAFCRR